jgi:hypothetical protein
MPVWVLNAELAEAVRSVVDRVVDARATVLNLCIDRVYVVYADIRVPHLVDDSPVRDQAFIVLSEGEQDRRVVAVGGSKVDRRPLT